MDFRQFVLEPNDARRLASLCGRQDTHLRLIESRLPVTIRNRGNQFEIEGEGEDAQIVLNLMDQFGMPVPAFVLCAHPVVVHTRTCEHALAQQPLLHREKQHG